MFSLGDQHLHEVMEHGKTFLDEVKAGVAGIVMQQEIKPVDDRMLNQVRSSHFNMINNPMEICGSIPTCSLMGISR